MISKRPGFCRAFFACGTRADRVVEYEDIPRISSDRPLTPIKFHGIPNMRALFPVC